MSEQNQSLREDIAFIRQMAEAGRDRPMLGGQILVAAGLVWGAASFSVWCMTSVLRMSAGSANIAWAIGFVVWMVTLFVMVRRVRAQVSGPQETSGAAWAGVGYAIFAIAVSLGVIGWRLNLPSVLWAIPSVLLALYGAAWSVAATAFRKPWMHVMAIASFVMAPVNGWFAGDPAIWLIYAISLVGLLTAPGLYLIREARRAA